MEVLGSIAATCYQDAPPEVQMDERLQFNQYLALLQRVVSARGGDPAQLAAQYTWVEKPGDAARNGAVAMAPLLTGGSPADGGLGDWPPGDTI